MSKPKKCGTASDTDVAQKAKSVSHTKPSPAMTRHCDLSFPPRSLHRIAYRSGLRCNHQIPRIPYNPRICRTARNTQIPARQSLRRKPQAFLSGRNHQNVLATGPDSISRFRLYQPELYGVVMHCIAQSFILESKQSYWEKIKRSRDMGYGRRRGG